MTFVTFALWLPTGSGRPAAGRRHAAGLRHVLHAAAAQLGHSQEEAQHPQIQGEQQKNPNAQGRPPKLLTDGVYNNIHIDKG